MPPAPIEWRATPDAQQHGDRQAGEVRMTIKSDIDAAEVAEVVAAFASGTLNDSLRSIGTPAGESSFRAAWAACGEFGLLGMHIARAHGGSGTSVKAAVAAMEALGEHCSDAGFAFGVNVSLFSHATTLAFCASDSQKHRYLHPLCSGARIGAYAVSEETAGSDVYALRTTARAVDGGYVLSGTKTYVSLGPIADFAIVFASTEPAKRQWGLTAFIVDLDVAGVRVVPMSKEGLEAVPMGTLSFEESFVPAEQVLGSPGSGAAIFEESQIWERSFVLASQVGVMRRQLAEALRYVKGRAQFGHSISRFQSVSNRLADMRLRLETAHLLLTHVAELRDAGKPTRLESALVKLHVSESFFASSVDAVRLHAGRGYTGDAAAFADLRDSVGSLLLGGTNDIQRNIIARLLNV
jgi:alkylation response protein AidB-like acyl-CoA dehydrogenase